MLQPVQNISKEALVSLAVLTTVTVAAAWTHHLTLTLSEVFSKPIFHNVFMRRKSY